MPNSGYWALNVPLIELYPQPHFYHIVKESLSLSLSLILFLSFTVKHCFGTHASCLWLGCHTFLLLFLLYISFYWDCGLKDIVLRTALRLYLDQVGIHRKTRGLDSHAHAPNSQKDSIYSMASIQNMLFVYS